jgi:AcrR family transcriptional regulator
MFREHGLEVSVGEIADAAGIGRGTVFRNFPTKDHLIAAVATERMREAIDAGRELLASEPDDGEIAFMLLTDIAGRQQANRALLEALSDEWFANHEILAIYTELLTVMEEVLDRGKRAGTVRPEVTAMDVLVLLKGMCMNAATMDGSNPDATLRYIELVRAAVTTPEFSRPLRGAPPAVPS